jgi:hypothetical protein
VLHQLIRETNSRGLKRLCQELELSVVEKFDIFLLFYFLFIRSLEKTKSWCRSTTGRKMGFLLSGIHKHPDVASSLSSILQLKKPNLNDVMKVGFLSLLLTD